MAEFAAIVVELAEYREALVNERRVRGRTSTRMARNCIDLNIQLGVLGYICELGERGCEW